MIDTYVDKPILILIGPTAIGKTELSLELAETFDCEIVSVDSMQVYRYMDIGTAKASIEERERVPHHLIDIVNPDQNYDAAQFSKDATGVITDIHNRGKTPLVTGGTGLYLRALLYGIFPSAPSDEMIRAKLKKRLDEEGCSILHEELSACDYLSYEKINPNDTHRLIRALEVYQLTGKPWSQHLADHQAELTENRFKKILQIGLTTERQKLYEKINLRTDMMIKGGLQVEVEQLLERGFGPELKSMGSIGYKHMVNYLQGTWEKTKMVEMLARDTRRYAKRQFTWFSKDPKIKWMEPKNKSKVVYMVDKWIGSQGKG